MLTKMVDGKEVIMSAQEEADIRAEWAANALAAQQPKPLSDKEKLNKLLDYVASLPDTPQKIKDLSGT